jgi:hypothetical protein
MPTLDPPLLDNGDDTRPARHARPTRWRPGHMAIAAFLTAIVVTVVVAGLASAIAT